MLVKLNIRDAVIFDYHVIIIADHTCTIDNEDFDRIAHYNWYLRRSKFKFYAVRKKRASGREFLVYMHRQITHCPNNLIVHHKNHYSLDNRKANLQLMTPKEHNLIHRFF